MTILLKQFLFYILVILFGLFQRLFQMNNCMVQIVHVEGWKILMFGCGG